MGKSTIVYFSGHVPYVLYAYQRIPFLNQQSSLWYIPWRSHAEPLLSQWPSVRAPRNLPSNNGITHPQQPSTNKHSSNLALQSPAFLEYKPHDKTCNALIKQIWTILYNNVNPGLINPRLFIRGYHFSSQYYFFGGTTTSIKEGLLIRCWHYTLPKIADIVL